MPCQHLPARINLRPNALCYAKNNAANQRAPKIAKPANDYGFKTKDQSPGPMKGSKFERMARNTPASATTAKQSAVAEA